MPWTFIRRCIPMKMSQRIIRSSSFYFLILFLTIIIVIYLSHRLSNIQQECSPQLNSNRHDRLSSNITKENQPLIFIGGMPRSGTTLMRAILDSHPLVRCGEETRVIPRILNMRAAWEKSSLEWNRLMAGGMSASMIDSAVRAFIYEILVQHSKAAEVLCDKDPFVLKYASYISTLFPKSKFILLIRDARAVIHSVMTRNVSITGFSLTDYRQNLKLWNKGIDTMVNECKKIGETKCLMVYYEQLVLQPKKTIENILKFADLYWVDNVLHHDELIGKKISLSKTEHSSDQVIKPINLEALNKWVDSFPAEIKKELDTLAPMLQKLGYDTKSEIPTYGVADQFVLDNTNQLKQNAAYWNAKAKSYARKAPDDKNLFKNQSLI